MSPPQEQPKPQSVTAESSRQPFADATRWSAASEGLGSARSHQRVLERGTKWRRAAQFGSQLLQEHPLGELLQELRVGLESRRHSLSPLRHWLPMADPRKAPAFSSGAASGPKALSPSMGETGCQHCRGCVGSLPPTGIVQWVLFQHFAQEIVFFQKFPVGPGRAVCPVYPHSKHRVGHHYINAPSGFVVVAALLAVASRLWRRRSRFVPCSHPSTVSLLEDSPAPHPARGRSPKCIIC